MNEHAQRLAIAKACGIYVREDQETHLWKAVDAAGRLYGVGGLSQDHAEKVCLPRFTSDLNACHEMENTCLNKSNEFEYQCALKKISGQPYGYRATAAQRSEAFLKCLGLWQDDPAKSS